MLSLSLSLSLSLCVNTCMLYSVANNCIMRIINQRNNGKRIKIYRSRERRRKKKCRQKILDISISLSLFLCFRVLPSVLSNVQENTLEIKYLKNKERKLDEEKGENFSESLSPTITMAPTLTPYPTIIEDEEDNDDKDNDDEPIINMKLPAESENNEDNDDGSNKDDPISSTEFPTEIDILRVDSTTGVNNDEDDSNEFVVGGDDDNDNDELTPYLVESSVDDESLISNLPSVLPTFVILEPTLEPSTFSLSETMEDVGFTPQPSNQITSELTTFSPLLRNSNTPSFSSSAQNFETLRPTQKSVTIEPTLDEVTAKDSPTRISESPSDTLRLQDFWETESTQVPVVKDDNNIGNRIEDLPLSLSPSASIFPSASPSVSNDTDIGRDDDIYHDDDDVDFKEDSLDLHTGKPTNLPSNFDLTSNLPFFFPINLPSQTPTIIQTTNKETSDSDDSNNIINPLTLVPIRADDDDDIVFQPIQRITETPTEESTDGPLITEAPTEGASSATFPPTYIPTILILATFTPTFMPTLLTETPSFQSPTQTPSDSLTRPPTLLPVVSKTPTPTGFPTLREYTNSPTSLPTSDESEEPTYIPTTLPSQPSRNPTAAFIHNTPFPTTIPSPRPTRRPTQTPTLRPSPSKDPTPSGTLEPSESPHPSMPPSISNQPTEVPTVRPSVEPSLLPTQAPSSAPSVTPSLALQIDSVKQAQMRLYPFSEELNEYDEQIWKSVTEGTITEYIISADIIPSIDIVNVTVNIFQQVYEKNHQRFLQQQPDLSSLFIIFNVSMAYRSEANSHNADQLVFGAFASPIEKAEYMIALQEKSPTFDGVQLVQVDVKGYDPPPTPSPSPEPEKKERDYVDIAIIVGGTVGGFALIILVALLFLRHRNEDDVSEKEIERKEVEVLPASKKKFKVSTEILVEPQDDVSTLGDPMFGQGRMVLNQMEKDEVTTSAGDDYDYTKQYRKTPDPLSLAGTSNDMSKSKLSSVQSASMSKLGKMGERLFADDTSFEQQFSKLEESFTVVAQAGKVGIVIDTPDGGNPIVHAIKDTSILSESVRVGDRLLAVDGEDCTGMTAMQVSKLISLKSEKPARVLVFARSAISSNNL